MPIPHLNGAFVAMLALSLIAPETTLAQSTSDLINDTKDPTTILTYGMGYGQTRHSGLRGGACGEETKDKQAAGKHMFISFPYGPARDGLLKACFRSGLATQVPCTVL